jgi:hypothetical protein
MSDARIELWLWDYIDQFGKRRVSRWRMTEDPAAHYRNAEKVEGSLEIRHPSGGSTSDFLKH